MQVGLYPATFPCINSFQETQLLDLSDAVHLMHKTYKGNVNLYNPPYLLSFLPPLCGDYFKERGENSNFFFI